MTNTGEIQKVKESLDSQMHLIESSTEQYVELVNMTCMLMSQANSKKDEKNEKEAEKCRERARKYLISANQYLSSLDRFNTSLKFTLQCLQKTGLISKLADDLHARKEKLSEKSSELEKKLPRTNSRESLLAKYRVFSDTIGGFIPNR